MVKLYSFLATKIFYLILLLLSTYCITVTKCGYNQRVKPIKLTSIISVGNFCPYKSYGIVGDVGDVNKLNLIIDTVNKETTVMSSNCESGCLNIQPKYIPGTNSIIENTAVSGSYSDGTHWIGNVLTDRIRFNNESSLFTQFTEVLSQSKPFSHCECEASSIKAQGAIGLGFSRDGNSFMSTYARQMNTSEVFAINFNEYNPRIWFGGLDTSILSKPIALVNLLEDEYTFKIDNVYLGDRGLFQVKDFVYNAQVDTTTPFIHLPSAVFHQTLQFLSKVRQFSSYFTTRFFLEKKCILNPMQGMGADEINKLFPQYRITFNSDRDPGEIVLDAVPGLFLLYEDKICPGLLESLDYKVILGIPFVQQYLVLFDQAGERIGLGKVDSGESRWVTGNWSQCSLNGGTCAYQSRTVSCMQSKQIVADSECSSQLKPPKQLHCELTNVNQTCLTDDPAWKIVGTWSECSQVCGSGVESRKAYCLDGYGNTLNDTKCMDKVPPTQRVCAVEKCRSDYYWYISPWSGCSTQCGDGTQQRQITCVDSSNWRFVDNELCTSPQPDIQRECKGQPLCTLFKWDWEPCSGICKSDDPERFALIYCYNSTDNTIVSSDNCQHITNVNLPRACICKHGKYIISDSMDDSESSSPANSITPSHHHTHLLPFNPTTWIPCILILLILSINNNNIIY